MLLWFDAFVNQQVLFNSLGLGNARKIMQHIVYILHSIVFLRALCVLCAHCVPCALCAPVSCVSCDPFVSPVSSVFSVHPCPVCAVSVPLCPVYTHLITFFFLPRISRGTNYHNFLRTRDLRHFAPRRRLPRRVPCTIGKGGVGQTIAAARTLTVAHKGPPGD